MRALQVYDVGESRPTSGTIVILKQPALVSVCCLPGQAKALRPRLFSMRAVDPRLCNVRIEIEKHRADVVGGKLAVFMEYHILKDVAKGEELCLAGNTVSSSKCFECVS